MPVLVQSEMEVHNLCVLGEVCMRMGVVFRQMGVVCMLIELMSVCLSENGNGLCDNGSVCEGEL